MNFQEIEELSYEWSIPEFKYDSSYRSPNFGLVYEDTSVFYLEIKTSFFLQDKMRILLCSSKDLSERTYTFTAAVKEGMHPLPNTYHSFNWLSFKPPVKVFEIESYRAGRTFSKRFTFKLDLKLRENVNRESLFINSKMCFSSKSDLINKEQNTATIFKYFNKTTDCVGSIYTPKIEEENKSIFPVQSSSNQDVSESLQLDRGELENAQHFVYPKELIQDFRALYTSGHMCDLEIRIGESILRAHKLILCARSSVFKAMMENDCLESSSNCIYITDCPAPLFDKFLKYIYTGELEDKTIDTVMTLYSLGDKYDLPALREACSNILHDTFSSKSVDDIANIVCDVLQLADCHNDSKLRDVTANFIVNHFSVISNKQSWKDFMKSNFELTSEILALVFNVCQNIQT